MAGRAASAPVLAVETAATMCPTCRTAFTWWGGRLHCLNAACAAPVSMDPPRLAPPILLYATDEAGESFAIA